MSHAPHISQNLPVLGIIKETGPARPDNNNCRTELHHLVNVCLNVPCQEASKTRNVAEPLRNISSDTYIGRTSNTIVALSLPAVSFCFFQSTPGSLNVFTKATYTTISRRVPEDNKKLLTYSIG